MPKVFITTFIFIYLFGLVPVTHAQYNYTFEYGPKESLELDDQTARKGYTIEAFDAEFRFGITPNVLTEGGAFEFKEVFPADFDSGMEIPSGYKLVSKIIEFDIKNKEVYDPSKPFWLQMKYDSELQFDKFLHYFDQGKGRWVSLPSTTDLENGIVKAAFHLPYAKLAVFDTDVMMYGKASWYAYKGCMCAASPDYPKGTQLLVTDLNADEAIVVTVNDWGPERDVFPDRVIDLDVVAFEKLLTRRAGVLQNIHVSPYIASNFTKEEQETLAQGDFIYLTQEQIARIEGKEIENEVITVEGETVVVEQETVDGTEEEITYYFEN